MLGSADRIRDGKENQYTTRIPLIETMASGEAAIKVRFGAAGTSMSMTSKKTEDQSRQRGIHPGGGLQWP